MSSGGTSLRRVRHRSGGSPLGMSRWPLVVSGNQVATPTATIPARRRQQTSTEGAPTWPRASCPLTITQRKMPTTATRTSQPARNAPARMSPHAAEEKTRQATKTAMGMVAVVWAKWSLWMVGSRVLRTPISMAATTSWATTAPSRSWVSGRRVSTWSTRARSASLSRGWSSSAASSRLWPCSDPSPSTSRGEGSELGGGPESGGRLPLTCPSFLSAGRRLSRPDGAAVARATRPRRANPGNSADPSGTAPTHRKT